MSVSLLAPSANTTKTYTTKSGNVYQADANGLILAVANGDVVDLANQGCIQLGQIQARNNYTATINPGATNDSTQDYGVGSSWFNTTTGNEFRAISVGASAAVWVACGGSPYPLLVGATASLTITNSNQPILLNTAAGSVVTLPAATGSGARFPIIVSVSTTSNAHKILAASSSDYIIGNAYGYSGSTAKVFGSPAATNHSIQMPFTGTQPSGGIIGDQFDFVDIAANLWQCSGFYQGGTTPTTPFSTATS